MIQTLPLRIDSVRAQQSADRHRSLRGYLAVVGVGLVIGLAGFGPFDVQFALAFALLACAAAADLLRPIAGVYLTVFFSVLGDVSPCSGTRSTRTSRATSRSSTSTTRSRSPRVEVFLVLTALSWFAHVAGTRSWHLLGRPLLWPLVMFGGLFGLGLSYGVFLCGGDLTIAYLGAPTAPLPRRDVLLRVEPVHPHRSLREPRLGGGARDLGAEHVRDPLLPRAFGRPTAWRSRRSPSIPTSMLYAWCSSSDLDGVRAARLLALGAVPAAVLAAIPTV